MLPAPDITRDRARAARRCASTRTSCSRTRCSWSPGRRSCCCPRRRGTSRPAAARPPRPSGASRSAPRSTGPKVGEARSEYAIFLDVARRVHPERADVIGCATPRRRSATRSRASSRRTPASRSCATTGDAIQVGGARLCEGGVFPTPDGRARFSVVVPADDRRSARPLPALDPPRQAVQLDGVERRRPAHRRRRATRSCCPSRRGNARRRRRATRCSYVRRTARCERACTSRRSGPATCRRSSPRPTCLLAPNRRDPISGRARLQRRRRGGPGRVTPDELLELFRPRPIRSRSRLPAIDRDTMRDRTERPGQYALDLVADEAACAVLERAPVRIVSEESGVRGALDASITVVLDPVDGSTNLRARHRLLGDLDRRASKVTKCCVRSSPTMRPDRAPRPSGAKARTATVAACARRPRRGSRTP